MSDNIDVVVQEKGTGQVIQSFDALAAAAKRAHADVSALQKTFGNVGRSTAAANRVTALGQAAQATAGHVGNLTSAMNSLNASRVTANLHSANTALGNTSTQARNAASSVRDLVAAFLGFQAIRAAIGSLIEAQVTMQQIHYGLLSATGSARGANEQFEFLRKTSDKLGTNLRSSAMEYTRLAASAEAMNVKVADQQALYTGLSKAATVLHLDQQKMQFATLALTQMFSKGKIQAEELRRQLGEAIPGVVPRFQKAVMEATKGTDLQGKSFDQLMKQGLLYTDKFLPYLIQALDETGRGWEEASTGLNAEINRLKNSWFELKVELSQGLFSDTVMAVVKFLSANMKELAAAAIGLGAALAVALAPTLIIQFMGYVRQLAVLVWAAAGPWGILAGAIIGVTAYLVTLRDEILIGVDEMTTLGDMMAVAWDNLKPIFTGLGQHVKMILGFLGEEFWKSFKLWTGFNIEYQTKNEALWIQMVRFVAQAFDMIGGVIRGTWRGAIAATSIAIGIMMDGFRSLGQAAMALLKGDFEGVANVIGGQMKNVAGSGKEMGEAFTSAFNTEVLRQSKSGLESVLDGWISAAQARAKARNSKPEGAQPKPSPEQDVFNPTGGGNKGADKAAKELERLKEALSRLIGEINPTYEALRKLAEAQEILDKSVKANLITQEKADWVMGRLRDKYKEVLDPIGFLIDKYKQEREVLQYVGDEQQVQAELLRITNDLKKKNYEVTTAQVAALKAEIEATQQAKRENEAYNAVLNETIYARRAELDQIKALGAAKANGDITAGMAGQKAMDIFGDDAMQGTQEHFAAITQGYTDMMAKIEAARQANLISEATANKLMTDAYLTQLNSRLEIAGNVFGQISQLQYSENKKMARVGKAAAIAQAMVATYTGATEAYKSLAGIPYVGPALGVAAAAAAVAAGLQNVAAIRSQGEGFRTGGNFTVGGSGGPDTQLVQFMATPGEQVQVNTPSQARAAEQGSGETVVNSPISVAVVQDREAAMSQMRGDPNMRQWVIEVIEENGGTVARAIGVK